MEHDIKYINEVLSCTCSVFQPWFLWVFLGFFLVLFPSFCTYSAQSHVLQALCARMMLQSSRSQTGNGVHAVQAAAFRFAARRFDSLILWKMGKQTLESDVTISVLWHSCVLPVVVDFSFVLCSWQGACFSVKSGSVNLYHAGEGESTVGTIRCHIQLIFLPETQNWNPFFPYKALRWNHVAHLWCFCT